VQVIDVEAAFLEGEMDHELYIDLPFQYEDYCADRGIALGKNVVLCLMMSQYGCVQSVRIWSKKFVSIVTNEVRQLTQCKTDPCIFYRRDTDGKVVLLMAAYIDDEILAGSVYYTKGEDDEGPYYETEMKDFVMDTVAIYEEFVGKPATLFPSPGYASTVLSKNKDAIMHQTEYRSIVGNFICCEGMRPRLRQCCACFVRTFGVTRGRTLQSPRSSYRLLEGELPTSETALPEGTTSYGRGERRLGYEKG
jgi:hypothetical protein